MLRKPFWLVAALTVLLVLLNVFPSLAAQISALTPIRQGDTIHVRVINSRGAAEIDQDFVVNMNGEIDLPVAGMYKVSGKNVPELTKTLTTFLEKISYKSPKVTLNTVNLVATDRVFVLGGVKTPGSVNMRDSISIMDALKEVGGLEVALNEFGNSTTASPYDTKANMSAYIKSTNLDHLAGTKVKRKGKEFTVNLKRLLQDGDISQNIDLLSDDVLIIPKRSDASPDIGETIYVLGAVNSPARFKYRENTTVMEAITLAGGLWNPSHVKYATIFRGMKVASGTKDIKTGKPPLPQVIKIDLRRFLYRGDISQDQVMKNGDVLLVSTRENRNFLSDLGKFVDTFLPIMNRMDSVVGYDDSIRRFNDRFLK